MFLKLDRNTSRTYLLISIQLFKGSIFRLSEGYGPGLVLMDCLRRHFSENQMVTLRNFTKHISETCTKASQKVGVLVRLRNLIPCQAKLILYKTAIMPHLTYCHLVWNSCRSSDRKKIKRVQERALRAVFKSTTETYEELLERAKLPTLYNRRLRDVATLMYKVKNNLVRAIAITLEIVTLKCIL